MHTMAFPTGGATCCMAPQVWTNTTDSVIREGQLDLVRFTHTCNSGGEHDTCR